MALLFEVPARSLYERISHIGTPKVAMKKQSWAVALTMNVVKKAGDQVSC